MNKKIIIWIIAAFILAIALILRFAPGSAEIIWGASKGGEFLLPILAAAALIDSFNPCAFSILLLTIAFLLSLGRSQKNLLAAGGAYIAGLFMIYLLIGLGILQALHIFNTPHFMAKAGAAILIAAGVLHILGELFPRLPKVSLPKASKETMARLMEKGTLLTAFALGLLVGLCEFPCTGGPYLMVLGLLHDQTTYYKGLGYLVLYNLIFILPLVVILLLASRSSLLVKVQEWKKTAAPKLRFWTGVAMVALGLLILMF